MANAPGRRLGADLLERARCDVGRDAVVFRGEAAGEPISCVISREALDDYFGLREASNEDRLKLFRQNMSLFERMARAKYLEWPVEQPGEVLVRTLEVGRL